MLLELSEILQRKGTQQNGSNDGDDPRRSVRLLGAVFVISTKQER